MASLWILGGLIIVGIIIYNTVVGKKNAVGNAFSSIDVLLKKRYDLIPNLVASVGQYMQHEKGVLTTITELRAKAGSAQSVDERMAIEGQISKAIGGLMVSVENYPQLKADQTFLQLQQTITETEEQISAARRAYNATILDFNNCLEMFPTNLLAGMMGLSRKAFLEIAEAERANVDVNRLFKNNQS